MTCKESKRRAVCYFLIIGLLLGMTQSSGTASLMQHSFVAEQSNPRVGNNIPSSLNHSDEILHMITQVNASILEAYIQKIQDFGPHPTGSDACDAVGQYLYDTLASFQLSVRYDSWTYKLRSGNNIEATLPGTDSCTSIIVMSAHYDSVKISPGANDDGSGVAVILAAAEILCHYRFNSTIRFVLFSGEEQGLFGSHEYVQNVIRKGDNILGDLNFDGVGYAGTSEEGNKINHISNDQSAWMVDISSTIALKYQEIIRLDVIRLPYITFGDHDSFVQNEYAASDFWQYGLTPYYHTSEDTLEHMNVTYLAKVCKLAVGTLATIAELHPHLSKNDITISIKGHALTYPSQFCVRIENKNPDGESANVIINIQLRNLWTNQFVLMQIHTYTLICNWTCSEEIKTFWEFKTLGARYSSQFISLQVIVKGINDDYPLYTTHRTIGIIVAGSVRILPT